MLSTSNAEISAGSDSDDFPNFPGVYLVYLKYLIYVAHVRTALAFRIFQPAAHMHDFVLVEPGGWRLVGRT